MLRHALALALVCCSLGCATQLTLAPEFASRAEEWPMGIPGGTMPPSRMALGEYHVTDITIEKQPELKLGLGAVATQIGGNWRLRASLGGATEGSIACIGPSEPWKSADKMVHVSIGRAQLGCRLEVASKVWTMLFDVDLSSSGPDAPRWVTALREARGEEAKPDPKDWDALVLDEDGNGFSVQWAHQTVRMGNVGGYYAYLDGAIVGAIDVTYLGAPKAYVARDAPEELRPALATAMATAYLIVSLR